MHLPSPSLLMLVPVGRSGAVAPGSPLDLDLDLDQPEVRATLAYRVPDLLASDALAPPGAEAARDDGAAGPPAGQQRAAGDAAAGGGAQPAIGLPSGGGGRVPLAGGGGGGGDGKLRLAPADLQHQLAQHLRRWVGACRARSAWASCACRAASRSMHGAACVAGAGWTSWSAWTPSCRSWSTRAPSPPCSKRRTASRRRSTRRCSCSRPTRPPRPRRTRRSGSIATLCVRASRR